MAPSSLASGWIVVIKSAIFKSALLSLVFLGLRSYDPMYANVDCGLKVMNTSDPQGYAGHPYWRELRYGHCSDEMADQYVINQSSQMEYFIGVNIMSPLYMVPSCLVLLYQSWQMVKTRRFSFKLFPALLFLGFWIANVVLYTTHFEQDITYLTGGILHHAGVRAPAINKKAGTISQGYVACGTVNRFFMHYALYQLLIQDKKVLSRFNIWMVLGMINLAMHFALAMVGGNHPVYHAMAINGSTPEMDNAWPYTHAWLAYAHCITHHQTGYSFGGDLFLDPIYDRQMDAFAWGHNKLLNLQVGSMGSNLFSMVFDSLQNMIGIVIIWGFIRLAALVMDDVPTVEPSKKKNQ
jgi:hypothetical protein